MTDEQTPHPRRPAHRGRARGRGRAVRPDPPDRAPPPRRDAVTAPSSRPTRPPGRRTTQPPRRSGPEAHAEAPADRDRDGRAGGAAAAARRAARERPREALRADPRRGRGGPGDPPGLDLRRRRTERRGQDHDALHGHRTAASGRRDGDRARPRRLVRPDRGEARPRCPARPAAPVRPADRRTAAAVLGDPPRPGRCDRSGAQRRPRRGVRPGGGTRSPGRRLLGGHGEEDRPRRDAHPLAPRARARRTVRVRRPGERGDDHGHPAPLHARRRDRGALEPLHGARPAHVRLGRDHRRRPRPGLRTMAQVRGRRSLEDKFVELAGGRVVAESMEWLHSFSD